MSRRAVFDLCLNMLTTVSCLWRVTNGKLEYKYFSFFNAEEQRGEKGNHRLWQFANRKVLLMRRRTK